MTSLLNARDFSSTVHHSRDVTSCGGASIGLCSHIHVDDERCENNCDENNVAAGEKGQVFYKENIQPQKGKVYFLESKHPCLNLGSYCLVDKNVFVD